METTDHKPKNTNFRLRNRIANKKSILKKKQRVFSESHRFDMQDEDTHTEDNNDVITQNRIKECQNRQEYLINNINKITLILGKERFGLSQISNKERSKIMKKRRHKMISIDKDEHLSKVNLELNDNIMSLKNIPNLKAVGGIKKTSELTRREFSPKSKRKSYPINNLMEAIKANKSSIKSPRALKKNIDNKTEVTGVMNKNSQKKVTIQLPTVKAPSSPLNTSSINQFNFSDFVSKSKPFVRHDHENRKRILNSMINESEIECIRDYIQASFRKQS